MKPFKITNTYHAYSRSNEGHNPPGRIVGVLAVGVPPNRFNPTTIHLTVSTYRHDFNTVVEQLEKNKKAQLPRYERLLYNSCFKNW
jgi:hypothetical protein